MLYEHVLKPALFRFDPEAVHDFFTDAGEFLGGNGFGRAVTRAIYGYNGPDISKTVDGIRYRTPFLLSAGFDYNGRLTRILPQIGLGGEEVGSVTARPCAGNPKPRLTRLQRSKSILVNKGLKNDGTDAIIERLKPIVRDRNREFVIGVSIARTNDANCADIQSGLDDYSYSFAKFNAEGVGDYYTINISCPNAYGGEAFTTPELLGKLLARLKGIKCHKPVYVKMPINIPWYEFDALLREIDYYGLHGVVIGNLNKEYSHLSAKDEVPAMFKGGLSGLPCTHLSTDLIGRTRQAYGSRFTIIGVGGVMSPETAMEKFEAGADLVQVITGLIFKGPGLVKRMAREYAVFKDRG